MQRKGRTHWQSDEGLVQKVWRFDERSIEAYGRERVEHELVELFPLIKSKGLRLELSYEDSRVGKLTIDGDVDMKPPFQKRKTYRCCAYTLLQVA